MGIYDRDYNRHSYSGGGGGGMRFMMPHITPMVKYLLIVNIAIFFIGFLIPPLEKFIDKWFAVSTYPLSESLQIWRIITYQFLHVDIFHVLFNMLVLFFFGTMMEQMWGSKKFIIYFLACGAMGGIVYPIFVAMGLMAPGPMEGASGGIYGLLAAAAILFPHMRVYVMGIFPLPMVALAGIAVLISLSRMLSGTNTGGEAAHLAGMAAGAVYLLAPRMRKKQPSASKGKWEKKISEQREFLAEVDRILDKVHDSGIGSLSRKEKRTLKQATEREQQR